MKWVQMLVLILASLAVGWAAGSWPGTRLRDVDAVSLQSGITLQQVQALSSLITAKVPVADVHETTLSGRTGGLTVVMLIKGDFLLGTDLSRVRFESVDRAARTAVLVLPQPTVTSPRLDQDRTRLFGLFPTGLWHMALNLVDLPAFV
jgi:Protein of unknown function (DUF4230)